MELFTFIVIAFILLVVWGKTSDLERKQEETTLELDRVYREVISLEDELELLRRDASLTGGLPAAAAVSPAAAPLPGPAPEVVRRAADAAAAVSTPGAPQPIPAWVPMSGTQLHAARERQLAEARERQLAEAAASVAASVAPAAAAVEPSPLTAEPAPAGPGLISRLLLRLGFVPPSAGEDWSRASLEAWLEGRLLAVVGGIALLLGAVFFLSLAFARGWITEEMRVLIGLVAGAGLLVLGELAFTRLRGILGHVLVAVGLAIVSLALLAATRLYDIVPVEWGLAGAFLAAVAAAAIAVRHDSELVAAFGLVSVLAAPPVLGASPTLVTLLFVAATLVGTTGVALFRTWVWLPPLAFVLAAPQVASYATGDPPLAEGLIAVAGFWLVNTIAAGGEEARHRTDKLRTVTVTLLLATAAFTLWAGFTILSGSLEGWRGTFLAAMAAAYLALGLGFLTRYGDRHPFGLVVAATGVATLTMAAPVQFGGPPVPIAWAAEAVALTFVAVVRRHPYSASVSVLLGAMALAHLLAIEYPPADMAAGFIRDVPFVGPEGMTFAFVVVALTVAGVVIPITWLRSGLAVIAGLVAIYVFPFELSGPTLVAGWAALATVGVGLFARVVAPRLHPDFRETGVATLGLPSWIVDPATMVIELTSRATRPAFLAAAALAGAAAIAHLGAFEYPLDRLVGSTAPGVPFMGLPGLAFAIVLAALAATIALVTAAWARIGLAGLAGIVALYVFPFELSGPALVWAWAALAVALIALETLVVRPRTGITVDDALHVALARPAILVGAVLTALAVGLHLVASDFPVDDLGDRIISTIPYAGAEGLSLAAALAMIGAGAWLLGTRWIRLGAAGVGLALVVYTVTFEVAVPHVSLAWGAATLAAIGLVRRLVPVELMARGRPFAADLAGERLPYAAAGLGLLFLLVQSLSLADPGTFLRHAIGDVGPGGTPFVNERSYVIAALAATVALTGLAWGGLAPRVRAAVVAGLTVAWLLPFEVRPGYAVAGWSALALAGTWILRRAPAERQLLGAASLGLAGIGALEAVVIVAPPDRLLVDASTVVVGWPLLSDATVALGALAIALAVGAWLHRAEELSLPAFAAAGITVVYLLSVGVVDAFQREIGTRPLDELQKSAQVGLSVLWSILGGTGFAAGLLAHRPPVRLFGLGLLGLATAKVFLVDLAALDVAYRVLSLVGLGVLLLVSAMVYARLQHPHGPIAPNP